jgi:hypothetical protein
MPRDSNAVTAVETAPPMRLKVIHIPQTVHAAGTLLTNCSHFSPPPILSTTNGNKLIYAYSYSLYCPFIFVLNNALKTKIMHYLVFNTKINGMSF